MNVIGKIKVINATKQVSATFKNRELVVTTQEQYPQHIAIEFTQDKVDLLDKYKAGDNVNVAINLRGREWVSPQNETKYFNSIQGWRIEKAESQDTDAPNYEANNNAPAKEEEHDDLPF